VAAGYPAAEPLRLTVPDSLSSSRQSGRRPASSRVLLACSTCAQEQVVAQGARLHLREVETDEPRFHV